MLGLLRRFLLGATGLVSVRHSQTQELTSARVLLQELWGTGSQTSQETEQPLPSRQRCGVGPTVQPQSNPSPAVPHLPGAGFSSGHSQC